MYQRLVRTWLVAVLLPAFAVCVSAQMDFIPEQMVVSATTLKLRSEPNTNASVVESLQRGALVKVIEAHNNGEVVEVNEQYAPWYKVKSAAGKTGYVFGAFVANTYGLYYEDDMIEGNLPPLNWYGLYQRDSFSDELRPIAVTTKTEYSEMYEEEITLLKTNQKDTSKFIIGTTEKLKTGYAGPLGIMDSPGWFFEGGLNPGAMLPISSGQAPGDTIYGQTYFLTATGCATLRENFVQIVDYKLHIMEIFSETENKIQELTPWFSYLPDMNPSVQLIWYGDIDQDKLPDAVIHDCPYEAGCRTSLFLSSKAAKSEILKKVCEHFWYGE